MYRYKIKWLHWMYFMRYYIPKKLNTFNLYSIFLAVTGDVQWILSTWGNLNQAPYPKTWAVINSSFVFSQLNLFCVPKILAPGKSPLWPCPYYATDCHYIWMINKNILGTSFFEKWNNSRRYVLQLGHCVFIIQRITNHSGKKFRLDLKQGNECVVQVAEHE